MDRSEGRQIYRNRDLPLYLAIRFVSEVADQSFSVAVGWTIYTMSGSPLALGIVGAVQFVPMLLLTLPAGEFCDRLSPRRILAIGLVLQSLCALCVMMVLIAPSPRLLPLYGVLLVFGGARAFADPAGQALLNFLVPGRRLPQAIAWGSSAWQAAVIAGPAIGGLAYSFGPAAAYGMCGAAFLAAALGTFLLGGCWEAAAAAEAANLADRIARVAEGVAFVWSRPILLGAISLDLFAVLLGGATALLPIYARDILHVGPVGLGFLRSAPAIGALLVAFIQARHPPDRHAGPKLFAAVAVFGAATLVFAVSVSFALSLATLVILGGSDMVSVNIRTSLVQLATPRAMQGRVSAVNMLFIGASSELGAFESGITAALLGTVPAVALGGVGTLLVAALWMATFPALRRADRLVPVIADSFAE